MVTLFRPNYMLSSKGNARGKTCSCWSELYQCRLPIVSYTDLWVMACKIFATMDYLNSSFWFLSPLCKPYSLKRGWIPMGAIFLSGKIIWRSYAVYISFFFTTSFKSWRALKTVMEASYLWLQELFLVSHLCINLQLVGSNYMQLQAPHRCCNLPSSLIGPFQSLELTGSLTPRFCECSPFPWDQRQTKKFSPFFPHYGGAFFFFWVETMEEFDWSFFLSINIFCQASSYRFFFL